jgi:hypothetical protein
MGLKGTRFATMEAIKWNVTAKLLKIKKKKSIRFCFQQWQGRWSEGKSERDIFLGISDQIDR